jgi:hypothetical protein
MKKMSTKTWVVVVILVVIVIVFVILKIEPKTAVAPAATNPASTENPYPVLNTASTLSVTLKLGDHITVGRTILTPTEVLEDSRCASGHVCIQAGTVVLAVNASDDDGASVIELPLGTPVVQEGLTTTLTAVTPTPSGDAKINPSDYAFTLTIEPIIDGGPDTPTP